MVSRSKNRFVAAALDVSNCGHSAPFMRRDIKTGGGDRHVHAMRPVLSRPAQASKHAEQGGRSIGDASGPSARLQ